MRHEVCIVAGADEVLGQRMRSVGELSGGEKGAILEQLVQSGRVLLDRLLAQVGVVFGEDLAIDEKGAEGMAHAEVVTGIVSADAVMATAGNTVLSNGAALVVFIFAFTRALAEWVEALQLGGYVGHD